MYYYTVAAIKADGTMLYNADYKKTMYLEDPSLFLSIAEDGIVIDFTPVGGADYYEILRSPANTSDFRRVGTVYDGELTTFTDTTAVEGESYTYAVRVRNISTGTTYTSYMQQKTIDFARFSTDEEIVIDTSAADTVIIPADSETVDTAAESAAEEKTETDIFAQIIAFIGQLLAKIGVDAKVLDSIVPVLNAVFGFVSKIITIA